MGPQDSLLRTGFIVNRRADLVWFLGLPFAAVGFALASQQWLPAVALASVGLWITVPHHFATWLRVYGSAEDWGLWKDRLIIGPLVIFSTTLLALMWAPLTLFMLTLLWDHQHSVMQQHGFARVYDFKARSGSPVTGRFDLALQWTLYVNLFLVAPLFSSIWIRELYRWQLPISADTVRTIQQVSWSVLAAYGVAYLAHLAWCWRRRVPVNPVKYLFIASSYFLWYFTAWQTASLLVWGIAHRIMHGVQYIVIVYWYLRRKAERSPAADKPSSRVASLVRSGNLKAFLLASLVYAVVYQLAVGGSLEVFGFGAFNFTDRYPVIPDLGLPALSPASAYALFAAMMINSLAMTHYYFDSFIWKVSDSRTQGGL